MVKQLLTVGHLIKFFHITFFMRYVKCQKLQFAGILSSINDKFSFLIFGRNLEQFIAVWDFEPSKKDEIALLKVKILLVILSLTLYVANAFHVIKHLLSCKS